MPARKTADQWFAEYGAFHQHRVNALLHRVCGPVVLTCLLGFAWAIPVPELWQEQVPWFNWCLVAMVFAFVLYARLSLALSAGMLLLMAMCYMALGLLEVVSPWPVENVCAIGFMLAWVALVVGRSLEGAPPSFRRDLVFLLIGPAWLMSVVYRRLGQRY